MSRWTPIEAEGGMRHGSGPSAVRAGEYVFLSSVKGVDPDSQRSSSDVEVQIRQAFANVNVVLEAAGLGMRDVVKVTVFLEDPAAHRSAFDRIWAETFADATPPARTTVTVAEVGTAADPSIVLLDVIAYVAVDTEA